MSTPEIREAAERLQRDFYIYALGASSSVPRETDIDKLATTYLAEHPVDYDEPLTHVWFRTNVGNGSYCREEGNLRLKVANAGRCVVWLDLIHGDDEIDVLTFRTRGEVLTQCKLMNWKLNKVTEGDA